METAFDTNAPPKLNNLEQAGENSPDISIHIRSTWMNILMSFRFSIGDFLVVIQPTNKIRKDIVDAPSQFSDISDVYVTATNKSYTDTFEL